MTLAVGEGAVRARRPAMIATGVVVAALVGVNLAQHVLGGAVWLGPVGAAALLVFARLSGLSWSQLGLHRDRLRSGARWGLGAIALVAVVYLIGVVLPLTRTAFLDARYHLGVPGALVSAFVLIPVSTILLEEVAFRSVLWGMLARHAKMSRVLLTSSALFGLWHILPSLHFASSNRGVGDAMRGTGTAAGVLVIVGIVAFTALGGVVAGELRRRSGSVLASAGMHWATNSLGVLFGLLAWRLAG
ncbi:CPBP family intramembrane glutamic endopeptidase [Pengzhenrongella frigida]|uniref:CPBP family intramembrane metalloprotease n=1 Tax=Pengzhenrongella frigida TaxID=1259133 RepID=A0A4Q5N003_9MICO|nr:CPBP family intramembrane glutamic endopeptidase [Cellulomonas sp. HLT2-17]RYV51326.1 CPBP family intramembrane metalloprotease [Cellulomonas sp. HLT2-17]